MFTVIVYIFLFSNLLGVRESVHIYNVKCNFTNFKQKLCKQQNKSVQKIKNIFSFMKSALAPDLNESVTTFVDTRGLVCTISLFLGINRWVKTFPQANVALFFNVGRCVLASETHAGGHSTT